MIFLFFKYLIYRRNQLFIMIYIKINIWVKKFKLFCPIQQKFMSSKKHSKKKSVAVQHIGQNYYILLITLMLK